MHATKDPRRELSDPADALRRIDEVLRLSRSAVWEVDRDGVFTFVSASFEDLLGYRPEELVGRRTIHDFYPREIPPELETELTEDWIGAGEAFSQLALPLVAKSGEIVWVSSSGAPIRDAEGNVVGFRGADRDITPLKRAEESLRASEQSLWHQIQKAPVPMAFTKFAGGSELYVNEAFVRTFGYAPDEVATVEAWFAKAYPDPAYRGQIQRDTEAWTEQAARGEVLQPREYRITCRDGRLLDVEVGAALVAGRFVGTFTDVTARRRSFEQASAAQAELRGILDNLPFPVAMSAVGPDFDWTDARAKVLYINDRFSALFGYDLADLPTVADWARLALEGEEQRHAVMAGLDAQVKLALAGERNVGPVETAVAAKDGRRLDVIIKAVAVGNHLVVAFEDTTERNRARRLLEESEGRLLAVIENTPVPVSYTANGARELRMNKAFTDAYGWSEWDFPNVDAWFEKAYPDPVYRQQAIESWRADLDRALRTDGKIGSRIYRVTTKSGAMREVEITAAVFEGELFGTFLDLTERNNAERLLREQRDQLAHVGRVSALGELAASLAHELDQPLGAILNNAEAARILLAEEKPAVSELGAILDDIVEDNRRAGEVLDRIRAMVQKQSFRPAAVDVPRLLRDVVNLVHAVTAKKQIRLETSCEPGLPRVEGDRVLLQQALLNLVLNSIDAIGYRADGVVSLRGGEAGPGRVCLSVSDNGGGVPSEEADQLLQPFHTTKKGGLGMGLPIVNSIVEQHGGSLRVDNQPGRGLCVVLTLSRWEGGFDG